MASGEKGRGDSRRRTIAERRHLPGSCSWRQHPSIFRSTHSLPIRGFDTVVVAHRHVHTHYAIIRSVQPSCGLCSDGLSKWFPSCRSGL
jgi:hypothetical protein